MARLITRCSGACGHQRPQFIGCDWVMWCTFEPVLPDRSRLPVLLQNRTSDPCVCAEKPHLPGIGLAPRARAHPLRSGLSACAQFVEHALDAPGARLGGACSGDGQDLSSTSRGSSAWSSTLFAFTRNSMAIRRRMLIPPTSLHWPEALARWYVQGQQAGLP